MFHFKNESQAPGVQNAPAPVIESLIEADRQAFSRNYALETQRVILESCEFEPQGEFFRLLHARNEAD